ncbi:hypothetical protein Sste5346_009796 [Sporothrix stenoceras]|uniref:Uncharacterized protein n=1 Tax=Sporothrix stenoceras TaxID=5173 RepID=A0ABR3YL47_9PEZI
MLHTIHAASWDEPVLPLTAQQLQAAADSHDYALAHDLVLALETDDHLQFHYSVADDETSRIPNVERSLADDHLPPLVLLPTKIEELWTVPRRVAGVLEATCRWLTEEELKVCEEAVVSNRLKKAAKSAVERVHKLKLEKPLLLTDPDEDCTELQKAANAAIDCGEDCVRKHGLVQSNNEEQDLFFIPIDASIYAAHIEETVRTEKIAVSEQSIRSLMTLMGSMEWSEKDQAAFLDQQTMMPTLIHRYVSPPLPPIDDIEYFVPSGDVCLVSDASDVSSGVSNALEEAERLLTEQAGEVWKDEAADLGISDLPVFTFDESMDNLCSQLPAHHTKPQDEGELSMSLTLSPVSSHSILKDDSVRKTEDDELFSAWIDESMLVDGEDKNDEIVQTSCINNQDVAQNPAHEQAEDINARFANSQSGSGSQGEIYEDLTVDSLFAIEENDIVIQAKIPVPAVGIESSLPGWHTVGDNPLDMLQWMMEDTRESFTDLEWRANHSLPKDDLDELTAHYANLCMETVEVDEQSLEKAVSWMKNEPDIQSMLINSIQPVVLLRKGDLEEPLEGPEDEPEKHSAPNKTTSTEVASAPEVAMPKEAIVKKEVTLGVPKSEQKAHENCPPDTTKTPVTGASARKQIQRDVDIAWSNLMNRHKKRKNNHTSSSSVPASIVAPGSQQAVSTKAPELLLGLRAFAEAPTQDGDNNGKGGEEVGEVQAPPSTAQASTIIFEKSSTIQPFDIGSADLPKAILSTAIPRTLRTFLLQLLPTLEFIERDYNQPRPGFGGIDTSNEADLVVSPSTGVIMSTMVGLRQTDSQKKPVFQNRVATVAPRYKALHILIYRNNARPIRTDGGTTVNDLPELSPSDAMALAQLQGFVRSLPCTKVSASYIGGGEQAVAEWAASLLVKEANKEEGREKRRAAEKYLEEEESKWELFLRKNGLNVYDAQIVLGVMVASGIVNKRSREHNTDYEVRRAVAVNQEERLRQFGSLVGCETALVAIRMLARRNSRNAIPSSSKLNPWTKRLFRSP